MNKSALISKYSINLSMDILPIIIVLPSHTETAIIGLREIKRHF